jgi:hypothetical protein
MGELELDPLGLEQVCGATPSSQLGEDRAQRLRIVSHPAREQLQALLVEGGNVRGPAMKVYADIQHGGLLSDPELATSA